MSHLSLVPKKEHLIREAFQDFILSRKASLLSPRTIEFYEYTVGEFVHWIEDLEPEDIKPRHIRAFLSSVASRGVKDSTVHAFARGVKAFVRFMYQEEYISKQITFTMPKVAQKKLPVLTSEQLVLVIRACKTPRDIALIYVMVDTGLRQSEVISLIWGEINLSSGLVRVHHGKGGKDRSVVIGVTTRRALLKYRRTITQGNEDPVFPLKASGLRMALERIGNRAGLRLNCHMMRRTFATLSLTAGISPFILQTLMGHSSLEMTRRYIRMVDADLLEAHSAHGPVDRYL